MKTIICTVLLFMSGLVALHAGEDDTDLERLQGSWLVATLTEEGKPVPAAETEILEFAVKKDVFTVTEKGKTVVQYRIVLDPSKTPKEINFTHMVGDDKGKTEPGIYLFDEDQLKLCLDEKKKGRPTVFEGKESETYSVIVLKKKP